MRTELYIGYTDAGIYVGFHCYDPHPDSLVAKVNTVELAAEEADGDINESIWSDDIIELFIDANFDHRSYAHMGINSLGVVSDQWLPDGFNRETVDDDWNATAALATKVGEDFWSLEYRLDFDEQKFPRPQTGSRWGFNAVRVFRGEQYNQWVRTFGRGHNSDNFGLLVFK